MLILSPSCTKVWTVRKGGDRIQAGVEAVALELANCIRFCINECSAIGVDRIYLQASRKSKPGVVAAPAAEMLKPYSPNADQPTGGQTAPPTQFIVRHP